MSAELAVGLLYIILPLIFAVINSRFVYIFLSSPHYRNLECYRIMIQIGIVQLFTAPGFVGQGVFLITGRDDSKLIVTLTTVVLVVIRIDGFLDFILAINRLKIIFGLQFCNYTEQFLFALTLIYALLLFVAHFVPQSAVILIPGKFMVHLELIQFSMVATRVCYWTCAALTFLIDLAIIAGIVCTKLKSQRSTSNAEIPVFIYVAARFSVDITTAVLFNNYVGMAESPAFEALTTLIMMFRLLLLSPLLYVALFKEMRRKFFGCGSNQVTTIMKARTSNA